MSRSKLKLMLIMAPVLMFAGWALFFGIILDLIVNNYFINFVGYVLMMSGFFMGMMAIFFYGGAGSRPEELEDSMEDLRTGGGEIPEGYSPYQRKIDYDEEELKEFMEKRMEDMEPEQED